MEDQPIQEAQAEVQPPQQAAGIDFFDGNMFSFHVRSNSSIASDRYLVTAALWQEIRDKKAVLEKQANKKIWIRLFFSSILSRIQVALKSSLQETRDRFVIQGREQIINDANEKVNQMAVKEDERLENERLRNYQ